MDKTLLGSLVAIASLIVGAILQYFLSGKNNEKEFKRKLELEAYLDYIKTVTNLSKMPVSSLSEIAEYKCSYTIAKANVLINGSKKTVKALECFELYGAQIKDNESKRLFAEIILAMRDSLNKKERLSHETIQYLILGEKRPFQ